MQTIVLAGIDYSMTSPAIAIATVYPNNPEKFGFQACEFYYISDRKRLIGSWGNIRGSEYPDWSSPEERFWKLKEWAWKTLVARGVQEVVLEDYAFAARGRVFHIGEAAGQLKSEFWRSKIPFSLVPPTVVKKFATGKGNADKPKLYDAFQKECGVDLRKILGESKTSWNPISDIVDAYYLLKWLYKTKYCTVLDPLK